MAPTPENNQSIGQQNETAADRRWSMLKNVSHVTSPVYIFVAGVGTEQAIENGDKISAVAWLASALLVTFANAFNAISSGMENRTLRRQIQAPNQNINPNA